LIVSHFWAELSFAPSTIQFFGDVVRQLAIEYAATWNCAVRDLKVSAEVTGIDAASFNLVIRKSGEYNVEVGEFFG
jgi:hypothetical protein